MELYAYPGPKEELPKPTPALRSEIELRSADVTLASHNSGYVNFQHVNGYVRMDVLAGAVLFTLENGDELLYPLSRIVDIATHEGVD